MKTHLILIGTVSLLGTSLLTTSFAANTSEYLHFTRHRDSNGNLLTGPTQHQAEPSVMQKTMMPSQPKTFESRSTDWGMSVQEVKENEPVQSSWELQAPVLADLEQRVAYHTQIEGIEAALTYTFYQDELGQAKYVFEPQHEDALEFVNDFNTVKNWISQSYGQPTSVQEIWLDDLYQYDKSLWGQAVKRGHLVMVAEWKNPGTDIILVLDGGNDEVGLVGDFTSTNFAVPVVFDMESQTEGVEAMIEEGPIQETLQTEQTADPMVEDLSVKDMAHENAEGSESPAETEIASQVPMSESEELEEIEKMLNEEYPVIDPVEPAMENGSMDTGMNEAIEKAAIETGSEAQASGNSEVMYPEFMDEHPVDEQRLLDEGMGLNHPIEPSVDVQTSEQTMEISEAMPLEPSRQAPPSSETHLSDDHGDSPAMEEPAADHADDHAMEAETELAPQHL